MKQSTLPTKASDNRSKRPGRTFRTVGLLCVCGFGVLAMGARLLISPDEKPTTRVTNCTEGGCHARETQFKFMHAPAGVGACEVCHIVEEPATHTFKLIIKHNEEPICSFCHIGKSTFGRDENWAGLHVHDPVKKGECTTCHNPHGSNIRKLINADSISMMCATCHTDVLGQTHSHPAVGERECLNCHEPHSGQHPNLLHQPGRDLCMSCHSNIMAPHSEGVSLLNGGTHILGAAAMTAPGRAIAFDPTNHTPSQLDAAQIHKPVLGECSQCHNPHGSPHDAMLKHDITGLCTSCHHDVAQAIMHAGVKHSPVGGDRACLNCHAPHQSSTKGLLMDRPVSICLDCHDKKIARPDGTMVASMHMLADKSLLTHGPVGEARCQDCHDVHGGPHGALLSGRYSPKFYQAFSTDAYELCFSCHDANLATEQQTTSVTQFRNGSVNLHAVHISTQGDAGRSCRMCHTEHAGRTPHMLRESVPYGEWTLPISFQSTETGGSCGAGCHRARTYDRVNAIQSDVASPK